MKNIRSHAVSSWVIKRVVGCFNTRGLTVRVEKPSDQDFIADVDFKGRPSAQTLQDIVHSALLTLRAHIALGQLAYILTTLQEGGLLCQDTIHGLDRMQLRGILDIAQIYKNLKSLPHMASTFLQEVRLPAPSSRTPWSLFAQCQWPSTLKQFAKSSRR